MFDVKHSLCEKIVKSIKATKLNGNPNVKEEIFGEFTKFTLTYNTLNTSQDDTYAVISPNFAPDFRWTPHLTPTDNHIAAQHIFRTPALIMSNASKTLIVIPDVRLAEKSQIPWYLDLDAINNKLYVGISNNKVTGHVLFEKDSGAIFNGEVNLAFYILAVNEKLQNPFRKVLDFFWSNYGKADSEKYLGYMNDLTPYVKHTYNWAFNNWKDTVWQEFKLNGKTVGAPSFIVTVSQSPNFKGEYSEREKRSIWNQAWFCSLRSATGLYRYAKRTNNKEYLEYALKTKALALAFPQTDGLFDSVVSTDMEWLTFGDRKCFRSKGWETLYFDNSNRNPFSNAPKQSPKHILDMSMTCYYMLVWYDELEKDEALLKYVTRFADRLVNLQKSDGFYPAWVKDDGTSMGVLDNSPESSMAAATLMKLYKLTRKEKYKISAQKAIAAVIREIIPTGRWEDFETYWSCCGFHKDKVGTKIERNGIFKQCNFSMYFTALSLLEAYKATNDSYYLTNGQCVLDEMLMTQSSYQPKNLPLPVVGGFGVMNCDGELNDSRQSLFAPLIIEYGKQLNSEEYKQRGISALKAGFSMMYCPENPDTKAQWEQKWPFFNEKDYGFMMENYGHEGRACDGGIGIGEFTIYDWGNGAASEAYEKALANELI
ncbi:MAG: hypothetical protein E7524_00470 [Ruminococcaceae bacterium]|nr:hypothetical protein [Oscillospiraceae bacterium]